MQIEAHNAPRISIGILAHNEEAVISAMLGSLFQQSIFAATSPWFNRIEVICLPNGCNDATGQKVAESFEHAKNGVGARLILKELHEPGKANAWNVFVHDMAAPTSEYIVLLDADIVLGGTDVLERMLNALESDSQAVVAVDDPKKDIVKKDNLSAYEKFLLLIAAPQMTDCPGICGQLYVARAQALKKLFLPKGLTVEDGFLRLMLLTNGLLSPQDCRKIVLVPGAYHYYETVYRIGEIVNHEIRILGGTVINHLLKDYLGSEVNKSGADACAVARTFSLQNPNWVADYINAQWQKLGISAIPRRMWVRRFYWPRNRSPFLIWWVKTLVRTIPEWILLILVVLRMRNGQVVGRW